MSEQFQWGLLVGIAFGFSMWIASTLSYRKYIQFKADSINRSAVKVGDAFYYIVPESEYVQLDRYRAWYENGSQDTPTPEPERTR